MNNDTNLSVNKDQDELLLELKIRNNNVVKYLIQYTTPEREEKALEALKVGVIAILSASPTLDTKIVEEKFAAIERKLETYTTEFNVNLKEELKKYFEKDKGDVPSSLNSMLGERGSLSVLLSQYFNIENGKVNQLLKQEIGPASSFAKSIDPANKESVISRIEDKVKGELTKVNQEMTAQFSLDKDDSGMSRVKKVFEEKVKEMKSESTSFFSELRTHLGMKEVQSKESEKGTQKGRDFESALYDSIALMGQQLQDSTENVTGTVGQIQRSKVGDYIVTLGDTSAAPGKLIVIEVKKEQGYRLKDAIEELGVAKENRGADCGIFVYAKGYEPVEMGDFKIDGNDFFCTVDEELLSDKNPLLFLEAAYKIARIHIVTQLRRKKKGGVDLGIVKANIEKMLDSTGLMSDLLTKAKTIQISGENIEKTVTKIKEELEATMQATLELLK
ncbi:MAG: hypothetical protein ISS45_10965 [Candidatus Omnitrophica bacterium]|nr:hypothetical protein [Candidatus Omnitrophota bacterium]